MSDEFIDSMKAAIATAPNEKIAQQLQVLLNRLLATGGDVPVLPGVSNAPADANQPGSE